MLTFSPTHVELNSGVTDVSPGPNRITVGKSSVPGGGFDRGAFSSFFFRDRRENRDFRHRFFCEIFHIYMYSFIGSSVESIFFFFFSCLTPRIQTDLAEAFTATQPVFWILLLLLYQAYEVLQTQRPVSV